MQFSPIDSEDDFKRLALEVEGQLEENNTAIRFSGDLGRGYIKKWHLEAGLYMRVWDLVLNQPVEMHKNALPVYVTNKGYSLLCLLTPESADLKYINQHQQFSRVREKSMALMPDSVNAGIQIAPHLPVQLIEYSISSFWLKQQPGYISVSRYFNDDVTEEAGMPVLVKLCAGKSSYTAGKLFNSLTAKSTGAEMLSLSTTLIGDFMGYAAVREETDKTTPNVDLYYEKVKEVENILISHLQNTLPRLGSIAQKVALSESTLKRYFKLIYGRSIYEYYLNRKMELAKDLLLQKPLTVNEAAEMMGYEKVSNFIDIFKKHHGYSPGSMKKLSS